MEIVSMEQETMNNVLINRLFIVFINVILTIV